MGDFRDLAQKVDEWIRAGHAARGARALVQYARENPLKNELRANRQPFAELCRRCGLFDLGLKALAPAVDTLRGSLTTPSPLEIATYSALLIKIGSVTEALKRLRAVPGLAEGELYNAFAHLSQWNFAAAIPHLESYLVAEGPSDYQKAVAETNLVSALVGVENFDEAELRLATLLKKTEAANWSLLSKNLHELRAQMALESGDLARAERELGQTRVGVLAPLQSKDDLLVAKQRAILALKRKFSGATTELDHVRAQAVALQHWETVRECDFHQAIAEQNEALLLRVFFGTPYPAYRERLWKKAGAWLEQLPSQWTWNGATAGFDLRTATDLRTGAELKVGQGPHRLLQVLFSDLYRPLSLGAVFAGLFPDQYYDPVNGNQRVANVVLRTRMWIEQQQLPLEIDVDHGSYRIKVESGFSVTLSREVEGAPAPEILLEKIRSVGEESVSSRKAAAIWGVSVRSAIEILNWGVHHQTLVREGRGPATRYVFRREAA